MAPHLTVPSKNGDFRIWVPNPKSLVVVEGMFFLRIKVGLRAQLTSFFYAVFLRCEQQTRVLQADTFVSKSVERIFRRISSSLTWVNTLDSRRAH